TDRPTAVLIATAAEADSRTPFSRDPRIIAARAEEILAASGHADVSLWSPELEFYLFSRATYGEGPSGAHYEVFSDSAGWPDPELDEDLGYRIRQGTGYHAIPPSDMTFDLRNEMTLHMQDAGIPVKYHHHENGAPGQVEIEVLSESLLQAGDHVMLGKYIVRNTAAHWGKAATFMPKPLATESGNGMHFHVKLMRDGQPIFYDEAGYAGLSEKALHFIGGILEHGRALAAITNPTTNSYRRLRPGFEAPTNLFFSAANRSAAIRIPAYATAPDAKTIEFRPSDATGNPYLIMAALLAAGLDGMERHHDPRDNGFGPFDVDMSTLSQSERKNIVPLPSRLEEALDELEQDSAFLTQSGIFPEGFVSIWIDMKRREAEEVRTRPHPFEYDLFFDC
ncbi:glutamine synthetase, partial [bacterium]|nr:glutamine synthetase [bacterium]